MLKVGFSPLCVLLPLTEQVTGILYSPGTMCYILTVLSGGILHFWPIFFLYEMVHRTHLIYKCITFRLYINPSICCQISSDDLSTCKSCIYSSIETQFLFLLC